MSDVLAQLFDRNGLLLSETRDVRVSYPKKGAIRYRARFTVILGPGVIGSGRALDSRFPNTKCVDLSENKQRRVERGDVAELWWIVKRPSKA